MHFNVSKGHWKELLIFFKAYLPIEMYISQEKQLIFFEGRKYTIAL